MTLFLLMCIGGLVFSNYLLWKTVNEDRIGRMEDHVATTEILDNTKKVLDSSEELRNLIIETIDKNNLQ